MKLGLLHMFLVQLSMIIGGIYGTPMPLPSYIERINEPSNKLCTISSLKPSFMQKVSNKLTRYTGFKFYKRLRIRSHPMSFTSEILAVLCNDGQVIYNHTIPLVKGENENSVWGKVVPVSNDSNLIVERNTGSSNAFMIPGVVVGKLSKFVTTKDFVENGDDLAPNLHRVTVNVSLPLQTINYETGWYELKRVNGVTRWNYEKYIPLLETPNRKKSDVVLTSLVDLDAFSKSAAQSRRRKRRRKLEKGRKIVIPQLSKLKKLVQGTLKSE